MTELGTVNEVIPASWNRYGVIVVIEVGKEIDVSELVKEKAPWPIVETVFGMVMELSDVALWNAAIPILVTWLGIAIVVRAVAV